VPSLLATVPLVMVVVAAAVVGVLVSRALRDEQVLDALRLDVRRLGEAHRAACESRAVHRGVTGRPDAVRRLRG
jgi:hypothetical protein